MTQQLCVAECAPCRSCSVFLHALCLRALSTCHTLDVANVLRDGVTITAVCPSARNANTVRLQLSPAAIPTSPVPCRSTKQTATLCPERHNTQTTTTATADYGRHHQQQRHQLLHARMSLTIALPIQQPPRCQSQCFAATGNEARIHFQSRFRSKCSSCGGGW